MVGPHAIGGLLLSEPAEGRLGAALANEIDDLNPFDLVERLQRDKVELACRATNVIP